MTSNINPNNIDTTYPVAGQDNDSQGFRDNFTNIKTNFQYAEDEISDLQNKAILKSALTGSTLDNNLSGAPLIGAKIQNFSGAKVAVVPSAGTATINYALGHWHTFSTTTPVTLSFTNWPAAGSAAWVTVRITATAGVTITLPTAVGYTNSAQSIAGIQGIAGQVITIAQTGTYEFEFHTDDGGSSIYLSELTRPRNKWMNPIFLASSEDLADAGAASLATTASYFSTAAAETATLAAGSDGQIKTFMMVADSGDMVITVSNAGWKSSGSGTITFSAIGQGCTLQYINSKWFCIGNNGADFA